MTNFSFYNQNSAKNAPLLTINGVRFYFSYETVVAVAFEGNTHVIENHWGPTTGKHLNWIDGGNKKDRLNSNLFNINLEIAMEFAGIKELPSVNIN